MALLLAHAAYPVRHRPVPTVSTVKPRTQGTLHAPSRYLAARRITHCLKTEEASVDKGKEQRTVLALQQRVQQFCRTAAVLSAATIIATGAVLPSMPPPSYAITDENLLYLEAWRAVDKAYVDKTFNGQAWFRVKEKTLKNVRMDDRDETYDVIRAMLASLNDPFTRFLEPSKYANLMGGTQGSVTGVGVEVGFEDNGKGKTQMVVVAPSANGPAETAGIAPGDKLIAIDGVKTETMGLYDAASALQGPEGSTVVVSTQHLNSKEIVDYPMTRQSIDIVPVSTTMCAAPDGSGGVSKVGMIRLTTFNSNSADAVRRALTDLKAQGAKAFVMDVRNNGGGLFPAGVKISKMFYDKGTIVYIADDAGVRDVYEADGSAIAKTEPLLLVVNRGTASASEVMAGALSDNNRATIAGERTFGKGLIQTIIPLSDGSAVVVTVARYQTPNGVDINKIGITPDWSVDPATLPTDKEGLCNAVLSLKQAPSFFGDTLKP
mmetsp:Transcript_13517/g.22846  ORF Transcript_13517/g.22846 Transcript_13517/m.22846 type:complete len:491 (-) Transcript_13517:1208-2680(-)